MNKPVWRNDVERAAFVESNCDRCFQPDESKARIRGQHGCPYLAASVGGKLPAVWTRRRNAVMGQTYRCSEFIDKPPTTRRRPTMADTIPLFDVEAEPCVLVPVDGWPDFRASETQSKETEHQ